MNEVLKKSDRMNKKNSAHICATKNPLKIKGFRKHETGFEPATLALARRYSTTEPLVHLLFNCVSLKTRDIISDIVLFVNTIRIIFLTSSYFALHTSK